MREDLRMKKSRKKKGNAEDVMKAEVMKMLKMTKFCDEEAVKRQKR